MIKDSNPSPIKGERNLFCPHYRNCLDHASKNYWEYWSCQDCVHRLETESVTETLVLPQHPDIYYSMSQTSFQRTKGFWRRW